MTNIAFQKNTANQGLQPMTSVCLDDLYPLAGIVGIAAYIIAACS